MPSHTMTPTLHGCAVPGGTVTAELIKGSSTVVDSATWDVQVVDSPTDAPPGTDGGGSVPGLAGVFTINWDAVSRGHQLPVGAPHRRGPGDMEQRGHRHRHQPGLHARATEPRAAPPTTFRVRAYGDEAFYVVDWGRPSEAASVTTEDCNLVPEFDPAIVHLHRI